MKDEADQALDYLTGKNYKLHYYELTGCKVDMTNYTPAHLVSVIAGKGMSTDDAIKSIDDPYFIPGVGEIVVIDKQLYVCLGRIYGVDDNDIMCIIIDLKNTSR